MGNCQRKHLRALTFRPLTLFAVLTLFLAGSHPAHSSGAQDPIARVNGTTIYRSDLSHAVEISLTRKHSSRPDLGPGFKYDRGRVDYRKTLDLLIDIELLYQESLKHHFLGLVEDSEERYRSEVQRLGGEDKLFSALQCNDMSPEDFRKTIYRNLSIKRLLDKLVYSRIDVTEDEVREYYEQNKDRFTDPPSVRIRQILIRVPPSGPEEDKWRRAEERAHMIYKAASTGNDFIGLARRHSEDTLSASAGGDMGFIQKGNLNGILDSLVFHTEVGKVTEPIRSRDGYHIIKVVSSKPSTTKTLDETKQYITTILRRDRARKMISRLIEDLRSKAEVEVMY